MAWISFSFVSFMFHAIFIEVVECEVIFPPLPIIIQAFILRNHLNRYDRDLKKKIKSSQGLDVLK